MDNYNVLAIEDKWQKYFDEKIEQKMRKFKLNFGILVKKLSKKDFWIEKLNSDFKQ